MNKIVVYRSHIEVLDYTLGDSPKLEKIFSKYDPLTHKTYPLGRVYDEYKKIMYLPRGIDIYWIENLLHSTAVYYNYASEDRSSLYLPTEAKMKYAPRDEVQETAIKFMLGINEFENLSGCNLQSVNLDTGKGKSYCSIASIVIRNMRAIIITSQNEWLKQWKNYILEYTNIPASAICRIDSSNKINLLAKVNTDKNRIYLVNHSTLLSYANTYGWDSIGEMFKKLKIGIKIYDEAHLRFENMCYIDFFTDVYKTYYVTATPDRSNNSESFVFNLYMKNVPAINLFDKDTDPHAAYMGIKYNSHPTALEAKDCKNAYGLDRNRYAEYLVTKDNFYKIAYILISKFLNKPGKLLIYIGVNRSIQVVKDWIESTFRDYAGCVGVYTSLATGDKSAELNHKIILSTTKSAGAAVDIKGLTQVINLAEPFKSKVLAKQTFGRLRASDTLYIDAVDTGFFYTNKFYESKKPVYDKYATKCSEVVLKDDELSSWYHREKERRAKLFTPIYYYRNNLDESGLIKAIIFEDK